jgi:hypothetical protein
MKRPIKIGAIMKNLNVLSGIFVIALVFSISAAAQSTETVSVDFTVSVYDKKSGELVKNLKPEDFKLIENKRKVKIASVVEETKPLSIVIIPTLGEGKTCGRGWLLFPGFNNPENTAKPFSSILDQSIKDGDELAIITTDFANRYFRDFDSERSFTEDFVAFAKFSDNSQRTITTEKVKYGEFGPEPDGESSYTGVDTNYVKGALLKSFSYLKSNKNNENRSVILLLRSVYNPTDLDEADRAKLTNLIAQDDVIVNWFGDNAETIFMKMFREYSFYSKLPKMSGGVSQPCSILQPKKGDELTAAVSNMLNQMRTRYRITYEAENQSDLPRNIEVKLTKSGKRKTAGKFEINAPEVVSVSK